MEDSSIMKGKEIEFFDSSTEDYSIKADKRRVLEVLTNLIQNAHTLYLSKELLKLELTMKKTKLHFL